MKSVADVLREATRRRVAALEQVLAAGDRETIVREVERGTRDLPPASVSLWTTLRGTVP